MAPLVPLDLDAVAIAVAHLKHFRDVSQRDVLAKLGVDEQAFELAMATWSAARHAESARGSSELSRRFGVAVAQARASLERARSDAPRVERARSDAPRVERGRSAAPEASAARVGAQPEIVVAQAAIPEVAPPDLALPAAPSPVVPAAPDLDVTVGIVGGVLRPALPFMAGGPYAVIECGEAPPARPAAAAGVEDVTAELPAGVASPPEVPLGTAALTLPQYASLRVELQASPSQSAVILARYGLAPGAREPLDAYWRARFDADPLLRMMFAKAYATYTAWLRERSSVIR